MLALLFLLSVVVYGIYILKFVGKEQFSIPFAFLVGSAFIVTPLFLITSYITGTLPPTLWMYAVITCVFYICCVRYKIFPSLRVYTINTLFVFIVLSFFGWYICTKAFSYAESSHMFLVSSNTYMDFGAHIPLIRSFSKGMNFPAVTPFFATSGGAYYMLTDFYAGLLEYLGLRIDIALNSISALGFSTIGTALFMAVSHRWKQYGLGIIAIIIFFASPTTEWMQFIVRHLNPLAAMSSAYHLNTYSDTYAVFWHLNTYVNQRQLLVGISLFAWYVLSVIYGTNRHTWREVVVDGILLGFLCFWHTHVFLVSCLFVLFFARRPIHTLCLALFIASPQLLSILTQTHTHISVSPGFIVEPPTFYNWMVFWIRNTGIFIPISIIGMTILRKKWGKYMVFTWMLFIIPNIFHISSRNPFDDHKFILLWKFCLTWFAVASIAKLNVWYGRFLLIVILCASGILGFFVLKNDVYVRILDSAFSPMMAVLQKYTSPKEIILTNGDIYDPVQLAGRRTLIGRVQYSYVYGGNPDPALRLAYTVFRGTAPDTVSDHISHIFCYSDPSIAVIVPCDVNILTKQFRLVYTDSLGSMWEVRKL